MDKKEEMNKDGRKEREDERMGAKRERVMLKEREREKERMRRNKGGRNQ